MTLKRNNLLFAVALLLAATAAWWLLDETRRGQGLGITAGVQALSLSSIDAPRILALDGAIATLQERLRERPDDARSLGRLGLAYLQKARESGNPAYYPGAEEVLRRALSLDPHDVEAMLGLGWLALARHDFAGALVWGLRARAANPDAPAVYGLIGDAAVELGAYPAAIVAVQRMVDLRPDLSSYTRVSYLRELHGDRGGAIAAMEAAVVAGAGAPEHEAWTRVQLGDLYFGSRRLTEAEREYTRALERLPDYPRALGGLGRVRAAQGELETAAQLYARAVEAAPLPELITALGDIYLLAGQTAEARRQYALLEVERRLLAANGVSTDLEFALFDLDHDRNVAAALEAARRAYDLRPSIYGADTLAWAFYKNGRCREAQQFSGSARRLGTQDPILLYHAGMIADCLGGRAAAVDYLTRALSLNPHFSLLQAPLARETLAGWLEAAP